MKVYGGADVWIHVFFASALVGGEWSPSRPGRFDPGERALGTHSMGGPPSRSGRRGEEKLHDPTGTQTPTLQPSSA
jgi:hypothetical protein